MTSTADGQAVAVTAGVPEERPARSRRSPLSAWSERFAVPALTTCLAAVTLAGAVLLGPLTAPGSPPGALQLPGHPRIEWLALALAFAASQTFVLNVQLRREARSVFLSEIPMVVGLLFVPAGPLVAARILGALLSFGVIRKQFRRPQKLAFNLALSGAEATTALAVVHVLAPHLPGAVPLGWLLALGATALSTGLAAAGVGLVIQLIEASPSLLDLLRLGLRSALEALPAGVVGVVVAAAWLGSHWSAVPVIACCALLLVTWREHASLREQHETLARLYQFSRAVSNAHGADEVVRTLLEESRRLLHAEAARLAFPGDGSDDGTDGNADGGGRELVLEDGELVTRPADRYPAREAWVTEALIRRGGPVLLSRLTSDPRERSYLDERGLRDRLMVPLPGQDEPIAVLVVDDRQGDVRGFAPDDVQLLEMVANHAATALRNGRLVDQLRFDALHDPLTHLPNRTMLMRELARRLADSPAEPLAVAILDLDGFKDVNDTLGHGQGDLLLQQVGERLRAAGDETGMLVARLGGDEFAVVQSGGTTDDAVQLGRVLMLALKQPFAVDGLELTVGTSIGVSLAPEHGDNAPTLLKRADLSMYEAKQLGCGLRVFDPATDTTSRSRLALVTHLRQAIDAGEIQVHLQPKISLADGTLAGAEALARWTHPEHGVVAPAEFVALAERSGLIRLLTQHVLRVAVSACAAWQDELPGVGVAANISLRSLVDDTLVGLVDRLLELHRLPAGLLTLEITETSIMTNPDRTLAVLRMLRERGVRLSIDDFGTGYTSLAYLRSLPVDELKIDRSFLARDGADGTGGFDATIVRSIVDLGHNLGLSVVAEGVTDGRTQQELVGLGCELGQGFGIGRPQPVEACREWMVAYRDDVLAGSSKTA